MARVTVEDCIERIPNRFDLVLVAAKRARQLDRTDAQTPLQVENDKNTVVALREIAEGILVKDTNDPAEFEQENEPVAEAKAESEDAAEEAATDSFDEAEVEDEAEGDVESDAAEEDDGEPQEES